MGMDQGQRMRVMAVGKRRPVGSWVQGGTYQETGGISKVRVWEMIVMHAWANACEAT